jgi:hypothetical protein
MGVEELEVMYQGKSAQGKVQLSRKAVMEVRAGIKPAEKPPAPKIVEAPPAPIMSEDELDVIAKAIEGVIDM